MITYLVERANGEGASKFGLSYRDLQDQYLHFCGLSDAEFMRQLFAAIHFACIVSWMKELSLDATLGDEGIVHQLAHIGHIGTEDSIDFKAIRRQFKRVLRLE